MGRTRKKKKSREKAITRAKQIIARDRRATNSRTEVMQNEVTPKRKHISKQDIFTILIIVFSFLISLLLVVRTDFTLSGSPFYDFIALWAIPTFIITTTKAYSKSPIKGDIISFIYAVVCTQLFILAGFSFVVGASVGIIARVARNAPVYQRVGLSSEPEILEPELPKLNFPELEQPQSEPSYINVCMYLFTIDSQDPNIIAMWIQNALGTWNPEDADFDTKFADGNWYDGRIPAHEELVTYYHEKYYNYCDAEWEKALDRIIHAAKNTRAGNIAEGYRLLAVRLIERGDAQARQGRYSDSRDSFAAAYRYAIYGLLIAFHDGNWQQVSRIIRHNILMHMDGNRNPVGAYDRLEFYHIHRPGGSIESAVQIRHIDAAFRIVYNQIVSRYPLQIAENIE